MEKTLLVKINIEQSYNIDKLINEIYSIKSVTDVDVLEIYED